MKGLDYTLGKLQEGSSHELESLIWLRLTDPLSDLDPVSTTRPHHRGL